MRRLVRKAMPDRPQSFCTMLKEEKGVDTSLRRLNTTGMSTTAAGRAPSSMRTGAHRRGHDQNNSQGLCFQGSEQLAKQLRHAAYNRIRILMTEATVEQGKPTRAVRIAPS